MQRRVVVTGVGVVSSAGIGKEKFWDGLTSGKSFVRGITRFDPSGMKVQIASEIDDKDLLPYVPEESVRINALGMNVPFASGRQDRDLLAYAQHESTRTLLTARYNQASQIENRA